MQLLFTIGASQIVSTCIYFRTSHTTYRLNRMVGCVINLSRCLIIGCSVGRIWLGVNYPHSSMKAGSSGLKSASKVLSVSFDDDHGMENMRERIAARRKKKQVADKATKSMSSKGKASKATKKATTDDEGRKLTKT